MTELQHVDAVDPGDAANEADLLPGTLAAQKLSCSCSILANHFGAGADDLPLDERGQRQYWIDPACPLHGYSLHLAAADNANGARAGAWIVVALLVSVMAWTLMAVWFFAASGAAHAQGDPMPILMVEHWLPLVAK